MPISKLFNCAPKMKFMPHKYYDVDKFKVKVFSIIPFAESQTLDSHKIPRHAIEKQNNRKMNNHCKIASSPIYAIHIPYGDWENLI